MFISLGADRPVYRQICEAIRHRIVSGELPPGARLPSTRGLAAELGVSRRSVLVAYDQLLAEGYVTGRVGSGTRVLPGLGDRRDRSKPRGSPQRARSAPRLAAFGRRLARSMPPSRWTLPSAALRYDFRRPLPAVDDLPWVQWRRLTIGCLREASIELLGYGPPEGYAPLRAAIARYLHRARGVACDPSHVIIVGGSQQALDLVGRVLVDPDDPIVIEEPQYPGAREVFAAAGARLVPLGVDQHGVDPAQLDAQAPGARLAYVTPSHQFPTGAILPLERRLALLDWAQRTGAWVVEDDYDSEYRFAGHPIAAIKSLDRAGRVIYVGTFSKLLFPALRLGYLVVPPSLAPAFASAKFLADRHAPTFEQMILARFIDDGHFDRLLRRLRSRIAVRRAAMLAALDRYLGDRAMVTGTSAGLHVLVWLRDVPAERLPSLLKRAAASGVGAYPSTAFYIAPPLRGGLVMAYASMTEEDIRAGIRRLAECLPRGVASHGMFHSDRAKRIAKRAPRQCA
jgi:GntR family transcriptional regulator/MocR family aminotransferase